MSEELRYYKIYYHGDFVGTAYAMTRDQAVVQFANNNNEFDQSGLMACPSN